MREYELVDARAYRTFLPLCTTTHLLTMMRVRRRSPVPAYYVVPPYRYHYAQMYSGEDMDVDVIELEKMACQCNSGSKI